MKLKTTVTVTHDLITCDMDSADNPSPSTRHVACIPRKINPSWTDADFLDFSLRKARQDYSDVIEATVVVKSSLVIADLDAAIAPK